MVALEQVAPGSGDLEALRRDCCVTTRWDKASARPPAGKTSCVIVVSFQLDSGPSGRLPYLKGELSHSI